MKYWESELSTQATGVRLEYRAYLARRLIEHFGIVSAKDGGEDSSGRAKLTHESATEVVGRAFDIADAFVDEAERRELIRPIDIQYSFELAGKLEALRDEVKYEHHRDTQNTIDGLRQRITELEKEPS